MLGSSKVFSSFSVADVEAARDFYANTLGIGISDAGMGALTLGLEGGRRPVLIYPKGADHEPASFTVLNFEVDDVEGTVAALSSRGVTFERYEGTDVETGEDGVFRGEGPRIAWFTDPSGNVLSVIEAERSEED